MDFVIPAKSQLLSLCNCEKILCVCYQRMIQTLHIVIPVVMPFGVIEKIQFVLLPENDSRFAVELS